MGSLIVGKKGAGQAITMLIMFIMTVTLATGIFISLKERVEATANAVIDQQRNEADKLKTEMNIDYVYYNQANQEVIAYIKNMGTVHLDPEKLEYFVDNQRILKNDTNINISITTDTDINNNNVLDKNEVLEIIIYNQVIDAADMHTIRVIALNGVRVEEDF